MSVVDCNYVFERSTNQLVEKLTNGNLRLEAEMNSSLVERLRNGVFKSKLVAERVKLTLQA